MFDNIYKGKKVLITGITGFKGSWLKLLLEKLGAKVIGYALEPNTNPNMFNIINDNENTIYGDIRDEKKLTNEFNKFNPDIIFHLAAQPLVRKSYKYPKETYETNVIGTLNVYEAARKCNNLKAIVSITTDKCYENKEWEYGYREIDPMGGYDPYSSSKGCVEILSASYRRSFLEEEGILLATARAGNVIGGGDWAEDRLIPDFVRAVIKEKEIVIRNPLATRPWQHVLEPLCGYLTLGAELLKGNKEFTGGWNFGPNDSDILSVSDVLDRCIDVFGKGSYVLDKNSQPHEAMLLKLDISKAKNRLKWNPVYDVDTAINKTISWYKKYYESKIDMKEYSINQIKEYINEAKRLGIKWSV